MTGILAVALACSSCEEMNKPLSSNGAMLMTPGLAPGGGISRAGLSSRHFHSVHLGQATAQQKRAAEQRAQIALRSTRTRQKMKEKNVRYVAVPVKRDQSQKAVAGTTVMKVDASTGKPTGELFVAKDQGGVKEGDTIKLGGDPSLYFATGGDSL